MYDGIHKIAFLHVRRWQLRYPADCRIGRSYRSLRGTNGVRSLGNFRLGIWGRAAFSGHEEHVREALGFLKGESLRAPVAVDDLWNPIDSCLLIVHSRVALGKPWQDVVARILEPA